MKRIFSVLLLLALVLSVAACSATSQNDDVRSDVATEAASGDALSTEDVDTTVVATDAVSETEAAVEDDKFVYKHVIIFGLDGMGTFHTKTDTPNIDRIFADAALTNVAKTTYPFATGTCWLSAFMGVDYYEGLTLAQNPADDQPKVNEKYKKANQMFPTIFVLTNQKYPDAKIASFATWQPMNKYVISDDGNIHKEFLDWSDLKLKTRAVEYIKEDKPTLLFLHFDSVDGKGHNVGYQTEEYFKQLTIVDGYLGEVYDAVVEAGIADETLFILATDHGGIETKHGNQNVPEVNTVTLGFKGKTITNMKDFNMELKDIAPIVVYALDLEASPKWKTAKVPEGLFSDMASK